jgi:hypothetical protein
MQRGVPYGFGGHDSAMEASFFVNADALKRIKPDMRLDEGGVLAQNCPDGSWMGASRNIQPSSNVSTLIAMVQTANLRDGNDVAGRGRLYGTRSRAVLAEREMRSGVMVVLKIAR